MIIHCTRNTFNLFPRGLYQPTGSFRFSIDALLLSSYPQCKNSGYGQRAADLGTGCGVVAFGLLSRFPDLQLLGIENQKDLVEAACKNSLNLGVSANVAIELVDLRNLREKAEEQNLWQGSWLGNCDMVLANPPYRVLGTGRLPQNPMRTQALFGEPDCLMMFCNAAKALLKPEGIFSMVFPAAQRKRLLDTLARAGFTPISLTTIFPRAESNPSLLLLSASLHTAQKAFAHEDKLILYQSGNNYLAWTKEALDFCPWLACNTP